MRDKQDALDYRFMPEPNLPALTLTSNGPFGQWNLIEAVGEPDWSALPFALRERLMKDDGLSALAATVLLDERGLLDYYRETLSELSNGFREIQDSKGVTLVAAGANDNQWEVPRDLRADSGLWITSLFLALLRQRGVASASEARLRPARFAEFLGFAAQRYAKVRHVHAKRLLETMFESNTSASQCIAQLAIPAQISDELTIRECVRRTIEAHPESVVSFRKRASKGKFQRGVVLDFLKKTAQRDGKEALNDVLLDRLVLEELASRGCQVHFDDEPTATEPAARGDAEQLEPKNKLS